MRVRSRVGRACRPLCVDTAVWAVRGIRWSTVGAFAAYGCASCFYFGYPVARHPGRDLIGTGVDVDLFTWMLGWWPHAILHWENPIVTDAIWATQGVNLAGTT